ncbi:MAG: DUF4838 domain-containing protein [Lentisphaeria bacterium]|nr:DUF4838 domain-containing protein [Lentisphaeria bacterium]
MRHLQLTAAVTVLLLGLRLFGLDPAAVQWNEKDGKYVAEAADILIHCLKKSSGEAPAVHAEQGEPHIRLAVGDTGNADPESFRIDFPAKGKVVIIGASPLAVRHGVCEFLERFYGVRWLMPGDDGEYIPENVRPDFSGQSIVMSPRYRIRTFALTHKKKPHYDWAARNRGTFNYDFNTLPDRPWFQHNLWRLLPQEEYTRTNPEFFPVREPGGPRFLPEKGNNTYWQYCFTSPGIADAFAKAVQENFRRHPGIYSVSLGVNDGGRYCRCETCLKTDSVLGRDSMDYEIRSLSYLNCMQEVARLCYAPGRTFGFLAYHNLRTPPSGRSYHPSLVPFLTYERLYRADPKFRQEDQSLTTAWVRACGSAGWYDYLQYRHFLIPKISLNVLPEALKWGAENGVKYYYAEAYPADDWHTGPMLWLILKLTWDPSLSADALLKDWCEAAVGKEAAVPLEKYYRACSDHWEKALPRTGYFQEHRQYLPFGSSGYLEPVTSGWLDARKAELKQVVKLASPAGKRRAKMILQGFLRREPEIRLYLKNSQLRRQLEKLSFKPRAEFDFDRKTGFTSWQRKTSKGTFYHDPREGIGDSGAAAMDLKQSFKDMTYMKEFKVKPGHVYRVTVHARSVGTDPSCVIGLRAAWSAPGKAWLNSAYEAQEKLTEDSSFSWRKLSVVVSAPKIEGCKMKLLLSAGNSSQGKVFFDDLTVEEAAPANGSQD